MLSNAKKSSYRQSRLLKEAAAPLHKAGIRVIAIGETPLADGNQLRSLTVHPADVIRSSSCDGLEATFSFLFKRICYGAGKSWLNSCIPSTRLEVRASGLVVDHFISNSHSYNTEIIFLHYINFELTGDY